MDDLRSISYCSVCNSNMSAQPIDCDHVSQKLASVQFHQKYEFHFTQKSFLTMEHSIQPFLLKWEEPWSAITGRVSDVQPGRTYRSRARNSGGNLIQHKHKLLTLTHSSSPIPIWVQQWTAWQMATIRAFSLKLFLIQPSHAAYPSSPQDDRMCLFAFAYSLCVYFVSSE